MRCPARQDTPGPAGGTPGSSTIGDMPVTTRRVLLAKPRGYCAGVDRAVQAVEMALERYGAPVYVRKQIVHNKHVVREPGGRAARSSSKRRTRCRRGRSSSSPRMASRRPSARKRKRRGLRTIDATCPLVTKVHNEARRFAAQDYDILLIGHDGHEEVVGTTGEAPARIHLVDGPDGGAGVQVRDPAQGGLAVPDHAVRGRDHADRGRAAGALPAADRPAQRRHLLRHAEPADRGQADRQRSGPGHRGRLGQLVQLGPAGRGRPGGRCPGRLPGRRRRQHRSSSGWTAPARSA